MEVIFTSDAPEALSRAEAFLTAKPVEHNLILTLLYQRAVVPQEGRYWCVEDDGIVRGFVFQSPPTFHATTTPMDAASVGAAVEAVAAACDLPGVMGDAATAARFAGRWTELKKAAARPTVGQRLYELARLAIPHDVPGALRCATREDVAQLVSWMRGFNEETGEHGTDPSEMVPMRVAAGHFYVWDDDGPVSAAAATPPIAGVCRVQAVYTPSEKRNRGYAAATVAAVSHRLVEQGFRCILYTDLGNPISNSVYRRIGYRAVSEIVRYEFATN